jgi:hypothetical protein
MKRAILLTASVLLFMALSYVIFPELAIHAKAAKSATPIAGEHDGCCGRK